MKYRMATALLSLAGAFISLYLYLYKIGKIGALACGTGGCETVQLSPYSRFLGIEVALIGVVGYLLLFGVSLASLQRPPEDRRGSATLLVLSGGAMLFSAYLTAMELFVIHAICRWCVSSAAIITTIFVVAVLDWRQAGGPRSERGDALAR